MPTFAEQFKAADGALIHHAGRELHETFALPVTGNSAISVRFLRFAERPVQGIGIKCEKCELSIAATVAKSMALWSDTAPKNVTIAIVKAKAGARISIFNQWRDEKYGSTMYRLNNAAMEVVRQPDGSLLFRCSDGWGEPDFNDLVFHLALNDEVADGANEAR